MEALLRNEPGKETPPEFLKKPSDAEAGGRQASHLFLVGENEAELKNPRLLDTVNELAIAEERRATRGHAAPVPGFTEADIDGGLGIINDAMQPNGITYIEGESTEVSDPNVQKFLDEAAEEVEFIETAVAGDKAKIAKLAEKDMAWLDDMERRIALHLKQIYSISENGVPSDETRQHFAALSLLEAAKVAALKRDDPTASWAHDTRDKDNPTGSWTTKAKN